MNLFSKLFGNQKKEIDFPPKPAWRPNLPIDVELIFEKAKYYTGGKLQFAIFKHGTVVFLKDEANSIEEAAKVSLDKIYNFHPDFNPRLMDDGNYIIQYSQPAFTIVFKEEIENNWHYIQKNHQSGICKDEVLINGQGERNIFDDVGKICLFGRAKMFMDAQEPLIVSVFNPSKI